MSPEPICTDGVGGPAAPSAMPDAGGGAGANELYKSYGRALDGNLVCDYIS